MSKGYRKSLIFIFLVSIIYISLISLASAQEVEWEKTFGNRYHDIGNSVQQTTDGGYIIVGTTHDGYPTDIRMSTSIYLIKTNSNGEEQWEEKFREKRFNEGYSVQQTSDGGYVIVGATHEGDNSNVYLIKTKPNGGLEWDKTFDGGIGYSVKQTKDGGYIVTGSTKLSDVYLIKTKPNGDLQWNKTFGGTGYDEGYSVQQTSDGGYVIVGATSTSSFGAGASDFYLIKTDSNGKEVWNKTFGGSRNDIGSSVKQTKDGGYVIAGRTLSFGAGDEDVYIIKTDSNGKEVWNKTFGGTRRDLGNDVQQTTDGGYIIGGYTLSFGAGASDFYLVKTDKDGNLQWNKTLGGTGYDEGYSVQQTSDGGYIIVGFTLPIGEVDAEVYLVKIKIDTCTNGIFDVATEEGIDCGGKCKQACGNCVPIIRNGDPKEKIDVVFTMAQDYNNDWNQFRQDTMNVIQNSYFTDPSINANRNRFNFWYSKKIATVNVDSNGDCLWNLPSPGWTRDCPQASIGAILHLNNCRDYATAKVFSSEPSSLGTFLHELGHGIFGLADEYDDANSDPPCRTKYDQPIPFANIFRNQQICQQDSTNPTQCIQFTTCQQGWWKSQPAFVIMNSCNLVNYPANICPWGPDAVRQVNHIFSLYTGKGAGAADKENKAIILDLKYNGENVEVLDSSVVYGVSPEEYIEYDSGLLLKIKDSSGEIADSISIEEPRYKHGIDPPFTSEILPVVEFSIVIPFVENINIIEVSNIETDKQIGTIKLARPVRNFCEEHPEDIQCQTYDSDNDNVPDLNEVIIAITD